MLVQKLLEPVIPENIESLETRRTFIHSVRQRVVKVIIN